MKRDKMNISFYTASDFPYGGAAENLVRHMALGIHKCGENVRVVRLRGRLYGEDNKTQVQCRNLLFNKKPKNEILKFVELISIVLFSPVSVILHKIRFKTDAIILYGIEYFYYIFPFLIFSKLLRIKLFRVITDDYPYQLIVPVWWKKPKYYFLELQKKVDKHLDGIICLTSFLKQNCILNGVKNKKILLVPHFIDIDQFQSAVSFKEEFRIGYCGAIIPDNGIFVLLRAFEIIHKRYNSIQLMLIGDPDHLTKDNKIRFMEYKYRYDKNIIVLGNVNYSEIADKLGSCQILVNPRISGNRANAGFPTKLGEYLACSKAVVTTKVGDMNKYFKDKAELVLAEPDSPESIAEKVIWLIENPAQREEISKKGHLWCKNNLYYINSALQVTNFIKRQT